MADGWSHYDTKTKGVISWNNVILPLLLTMYGKLVWENVTKEIKINYRKETFAPESSVWAEKSDNWQGSSNNRWY